MRGQHPYNFLIKFLMILIFPHQPIILSYISIYVDNDKTATLRYSLQNHLILTLYILQYTLPGSESVLFTIRSLLRFQRNDIRIILT